MMQAATAPTFEPVALADPAFMVWAVRVGLRLANKRKTTKPSTYPQEVNS